MRFGQYGESDKVKHGVPYIAREIGLKPCTVWGIIYTYLRGKGDRKNYIDQKPYENNGYLRLFTDDEE